MYQALGPLRSSLLAPSAEIACISSFRSRICVTVTQAVKSFFHQEVCGDLHGPLENLTPLMVERHLDCTEACGMPCFSLSPRSVSLAILRFSISLL